MRDFPLPWSVDGSGCIVDAQRKAVAFIPYKSNHDLILMAVNAYEPMRAVIVELRDALENGRSAWEPLKEAERLLRLHPHISKIGE